MAREALGEELALGDVRVDAHKLVHGVGALHLVRVALLGWVEDGMALARLADLAPRHHLGLRQLRRGVEAVEAVEVVEAGWGS